MIAALFVEKGGAYFGLDEIDPWDQERDARQYPGPHPVIAHPPCQRWGKMYAGSPYVIARTGVRKKRGDDDGCFESALKSVREFGGVLEHPWGSRAFAHFGLNTPSRAGAWIVADNEGGWICCVEQGGYGHYARKPTILLTYRCELPRLEWGESEHRIPAWAIEKYGEKKARKIGELALSGGGTDNHHRIHTPGVFRDILINMAKSVQK